MNSRTVPSARTCIRCDVSTHVTQCCCDVVSDVINELLRGWTATVNVHHTCRLPALLSSLCHNKWMNKWVSEWMDIYIMAQKPYLRVSRLQINQRRSTCVYLAFLLWWPWPWPDDLYITVRFLLWRCTLTPKMNFLGQVFRKLSYDKQTIIDREMSAEISATLCSHQFTSRGLG